LTLSLPPSLNQARGMAVPIKPSGRFDREVTTDQIKVCAGDRVIGAHWDVTVLTGVAPPWISQLTLSMSSLSTRQWRVRRVQTSRAVYSCTVRTTAAQPLPSSRNHHHLRHSRLAAGLPAGSRQSPLLLLHLHPGLVTPRPAAPQSQLRTKDRAASRRPSPSSLSQVVRFSRRSRSRA